MADDSYWDEKKKAPNIFDQPDGSAANRATSARSKKTTTLGRNSTTPVATRPIGDAGHRHSLATTSLTPTTQPVTPSSATLPRRIPDESSSSGSFSSYSLSESSKTSSHVTSTVRTTNRDLETSGACVKCKKVMENNVLTEFEGNLMFCKTSCRLDVLKEIAMEISTGKTERMYQIKSVESKCFLLDETVKNGTCDAIVRVAAYMSQSCRAVFQRELKARPVAFRHYISYLKQMGFYEEAADLLDASGCFDEAGMLRMSRLSTDLSSPETISRLSNINVIDPLFSSLKDQSVHLAELHEKLKGVCKANYDLAERHHNNPDAGNVSEWYSFVPAPKTLHGVPLISTLLFLIFYKEGSFDPKTICNEFRVDDRHFAWVWVQAHALLMKWSELEKAVIQKSLFRTDKSILPPDRVARYVYNTALALYDNATAFPSDIRACISRFLKLVSDSEQRFELALKFDAWEIGVNTCVQLKDRRYMQRLHSSQIPKSHPWEVTKKFLETPPNKWRSI